MIPQPVEDWLDSISGLELALIVLAVVGGLWGAYKFSRKALPGVVAFAKGIVHSAEILAVLNGLPEFMRETTTDLAQIKHELFPNGGGSLRDSNDRQELRLAKVEAKLDNDHERIAELSAELERKERKRRGESEEQAHGDLHD